jgi:hypothetical protein
MGVLLLLRLLVRFFLCDYIGIVSDNTATWIWNHVAREYGKSLAEERLTL